MKKLILLFALMVLSYEATLAQCPTVCATNRTTTINLDVQPVCTTGTFATIGGEITNNNNNCNDNNNISCHRFILTRGAFSTITGISADVGQGANCNGDITVAYSNINGVCQQIATAGSQTNLTINFPSTLNPDGSWAVTQISVYICKNSSSLMTFCNLCVVSLCDINITCPASTNLGAYNCNNQAPALPTTITQITSAPYNFVIPTVPSSCGVLRVIATDSPSPNYCTTTTQTITRNIRVYLDANNNSNFDVGEQSSPLCPFTYTIQARPAPNVTCPAPVSMAACASQSAINTAYASWLAGFQATGGCGNITTTNLSAFQTAPSACANQNITVTINYSATDNCSTATCTSTFTVLAQPALSVNCPAPVTMTACASQAAINTAYAAWLAGFQTTGGCSPTSTNLTAFQTPPSACATQDVTVTINYTATDDCKIGRAHV